MCALCQWSLLSQCQSVSKCQSVSTCQSVCQCQSVSTCQSNQRLIFAHVYFQRFSICCQYFGTNLFCNHIYCIDYNTHPIYIRILTHLYPTAAITPGIRIWGHQKVGHNSSLRISVTSLSVSQSQLVSQSQSVCRSITISQSQSVTFSSWPTMWCFISSVLCTNSRFNMLQGWHQYNSRGGARWKSENKTRWKSEEETSEQKNLMIWNRFLELN